MFETVRELWESLSEVVRLLAAVGGGATATTSVYAVGRAALPRLFRRREDSPALAAFLTALGSDRAAFDATKLRLSCPGAEVAFDASLAATIILAEYSPDADLATVLVGGKGGREWRRASRAAGRRALEVMERDRTAANEAAASALAESMAKALRSPK